MTFVEGLAIAIGRRRTRGGTLEEHLSWVEHHENQPVEWFALQELEGWPDDDMH